MKGVSRNRNSFLDRQKSISRAVVKDFLTTALDGKMYKVRYYNLDVFISIGYRVKSKRGVEFRICANRILKEHIIKGYSINKNRMQ